MRSTSNAQSHMGIEGVSHQSASSRPVQAPARPGREPSAPSVRDTLSADELAYFADLEQMGPLVYGRGKDSSGNAPVPRLGQRIDVRA